ncbi:MAG: hypothetical protein JW976_06210 [Syntrophaceae bacterium]|nr:hypothetical protein [Syntrophaceae bacterium]
MKTVFKICIFFFPTWIVLAYITGILSFGSILSSQNVNQPELKEKGEIIVAMGFGINTDKKGRNLSGISNDSLLNWIAANTLPQRIIAQEGIILAKKSENCSQAAQHLSIVPFDRMHEHNSKYVNTFWAARLALKKISEVYNQKNPEIVVVAHQHQLKRAVLNLKRIAKTDKRWKEYKFIVPEIHQIPYDKHSNHIQTRHKGLYLLVETLISRPRDFLSFIFLKFGILLAAIGIILFSIYLVFRINHLRHGRLIKSRDENNMLALFILSNSGIWLFAVSIFFIMNRFGILNWQFTVLAGAATGLITGKRSMIFWNHTGSYEKKPALGEPIGAMGAGCFSLFMNVVFGAFLGWLL